MFNTQTISESDSVIRYEALAPDVPAPAHVEFSAIGFVGRRAREDVFQLVRAACAIY